MPMSLLSLDQRRPWPPTPTRRSPSAPRRCSPRAAACPTPTAQKVIDALVADRPEGRRRRARARRSSRSSAPSATRTPARAARSAPTSPAWPRTRRASCSSTSSTRAERRGELPPVHRRDHRRPRPQRPARRRDEDLRRAARRRGEEADDPPRGHRGARRRRRSRSCPRGSRSRSRPRGWPTCSQFLTQKGKYLPLDLRKVATVDHHEGDVLRRPAHVERLVFDDWGPKIVDGVPFVLVDPQGDRTPNAVMLHGPIGTIPPKMPKSVSLPVNATAKAIHLLSGVTGWGFPAGREGTRLDDRPPPLRGRHDGGPRAEERRRTSPTTSARRTCPGSKLAFKLGGQQVRYLTVVPGKKQTIASIELVKGSDRSAPIVLAATVEGFE